MANKYHVYGLGAALVDTEIQVSDEDLASMNVDKGHMTLVDEARRQELMTALEGHLIHSSRASGGSAGNSIIAASYFGASTFFSGKVAADDNGDFYMQDMQRAGVTTPEATPEQGVTGKCLILITPDAERSMNTFLGASESFSERELDLQAIGQSDYVYIESYLVTSDSGRAAAITARETAQASNTKVSLSFSDPGIVSFFKDGIKQMMGGKIDLVFCNLDEALAFADTDQLDTAVEVLKTVADEFVITLGADGALVYHQGERVKVDGFKVNAVDTNGAGDMFAGAYLYSLSQSDDRERAAKFASRCAAEVVSQFGPRLRAEQYQPLLEEFKA